MAAATAAGVAKSTFQNWVEGKADPSFEGMVRFARETKVSVDWIATGAAQAGRETPSLGPDFVMVPKYNVQASAGAGALQNRENVVDFLAFQEQWVRRELRVDPRHLALITAVGDSMEPTIRAGDLLLVDTAINRFVDDAIYIVAVGGHILVKRVQLFMHGAVIVKSDNPAYVEQTLSPAEASEAVVSGRVRWIGRLM